MASFEIYRNRETKRLELRRRRRKCLHFYYYWLDRQLGFCHVRLQSWFPFEIQVWVNGREALSKALTARRVAHLRHANAIMRDGFTWGNHQHVDRKARAYVAEVVREFVRQRQNRQAVLS